MLLKISYALELLVFTIMYLSSPLLASNAEEHMQASDQNKIGTGEKGHGFMGFRVGAYNNSDSGEE